MLGVFGNMGSADAVRALARRPVEVPDPPTHSSLAGTFAAIGAPSRVGVRDVLQHLRRRELAAVPGVPADPWRLNEQLLAGFMACHGLNVARRQLLNTLNVRKKLENVSHIVSARVAAGLSASTEQAQLAGVLADCARRVEMATETWEAASRHFTRLTRYLPAQLDDRVSGFAAIKPEEIDRLAQASLLACPQSQAHLKELALEGARRRDASPDHVAPSANEMSVWLLRLQQARGHAISRFAQARETYLQSEMEWDLARTRVARAHTARQIAEAQFRLGVRGVLAFANALVDLVQVRNELLQRDSDACGARCSLYALALQLPEQLDLC